MRRFSLYLFDLILVAASTIGALYLRDNFELIEPRLWALLPYLALSILAAALLLPAAGVERTVWRYSTLSDYMRLVGATIATVGLSVVLGFSLNRLDGVARSLPVLQGLLMIILLTGVRVFMRLRHESRLSPVQLAAPSVDGGVEVLLVVGINRLTELFLRTVATLAADRVRVAGLLGGKARHLGRSVLQQKVLGPPEEILRILADLEVHGVFVNRIIVTVPFDGLTSHARDALLAVERTTSIRVEFLSETFGISGRRDASGQGAQEDRTAGLAFSVAYYGLSTPRRRAYMRVKRAFDFAVSACLIALLAPLMVVVAALVAVDVGFPVAFWQQRPGLGGRSFRLYKFRTMAPAHDAAGQRVPDAERLSAIGRFIRRSRLDELPQLFSILMGDMSFVGPRPLLPVDQPPEYAARLLMPPGLTGWAQVKGGRIISAADKAALDVWYVVNASLLLDLRILIETVPTVVFGEKVSAGAIRKAWRDLAEVGIARVAPPQPVEPTGSAPVGEAGVPRAA